MQDDRRQSERVLERGIAIQEAENRARDRREREMRPKWAEEARREQAQVSESHVDELAARGRAAQNLVGRDNVAYQQQQEKAQAGFLADWKAKRARLRDPEVKAEAVRQYIEKEQREFRERQAAEEARQRVLADAEAAAEAVRQAQRRGR